MGGGGFNPEIHPWGRCGYFLEQNIIHMLLKCTVNQFAVCEVLKCHNFYLIKDWCKSAFKQEFFLCVSRSFKLVG